MLTAEASKSQQKKCSLGISQQIFTICRPVRSHAWRHVNGSPALPSRSQPCHVTQWWLSTEPQPISSLGVCCPTRTEIVTSCSTKAEFLWLGSVLTSRLSCMASSGMACPTGPHRSVPRHVSGLRSICVNKCTFIENKILLRALIQANT